MSLGGGGGWAMDVVFDLAEPATDMTPTLKRGRKQMYNGTVNIQTGSSDGGSFEAFEIHVLLSGCQRILKHSFTSVYVSADRVTRTPFRIRDKIARNLNGQVNLSALQSCTRQNSQNKKLDWS